MLSDYHKYRIYEMLPGISVWTTLIGAVVLSFTYPIAMIYFVIIFDIYWLTKVLYFSIYLILSWLRFRKVSQADWRTILFSEVKNWDDKQHVVFLTLYKEDWEVVETAMQSVCDSVYDKSKFTIVIAGEERAKERFDEVCAQARKKFGHCFGDIVGVLHPKDLADEIPGKGSNLNYAEGKMKEYIDKKGWDYANVIVTVFDIDTICHKEYFSYLTYLYCKHPRPTHTSFQPVVLYNNNIWESPMVLRIMAFGTTFWMLNALSRQDTLVTFSSHSMSFQALYDVGYHDKRIVSEDSRIFFQCLLRYNGDYEVTPMYIPVSMDTVRDDSWWKSIVNLYKQKRRWAWGTEHIPYLLWEFGKKGKAINFRTKFKWIFAQWEGKWSWAVVAILITVLGRFPIWFAPDWVRESALYFNTPHILQILMRVALIGLFVSATLSFLLLPKRPATYPKHAYLSMVLQWALLPITLILVGAIPAIDSITHLMFGKYLGFNVSQKKRKKIS